MPMSSAEGKEWTKERVAALAGDRAVTVLDIGPGVGTYAKLLAGPTVSRLIGVEIYEPYVTTYRLRDYYDEIILGDARAVDLPAVDVVILATSPSTMSEEDALRLWQRAADAAGLAVYLSIPIVHYPQGEIEGNPHEHHVVDDWSHDKVLTSFDGIGEWWLGTEVGVYERLTG